MTRTTSMKELMAESRDFPTTTLVSGTTDRGVLSESVGSEFSDLGFFGYLNFQ
ncbi:hypothetical protein Scep_006888 [Stephania cephalantha]|uniref:Uncharacterized protein n=1 Tax=Stephania cephalantha TaxID=152367 RepID=A0AAP0K8U0_9MAGN